jgi:hypothetical protein
MMSLPMSFLLFIGIKLVFVKVLTLEVGWASEGSARSTAQ